MKPRTTAHRLASLAKLAGFACLMFVHFAEAQVHGCTPETATDRTGEAVVDLGWDFNHSSCIVVDPGTTVRWIVASSFGLHPLVGGVSPASDASSPISSASIDGDVASVMFDAPGTYPYFCDNHRSNMTGVVYVAAPPPLEDTPLGQRHALTGPADFLIRGVPLAVDTNANGRVDSLDLPAAIAVASGDVPDGAELDRAWLYWGGGQDQPGESVPGTPDDTITLTVPDGSPLELTADACYGSDGASAAYDVFVCRADISARLAAGFLGDYVIEGYDGLIEDGGSDNASAALLLFYTHESLEPHAVLLYDGLVTMQSNIETTAMSGFVSPGLGGSFAWYTLEGDVAGSDGESVSLQGQPGGGSETFSDAVNPAGNPMNQTLNTVTPEVTDAISLDVDRFGVTALGSNDTAAEVTWSAGTDKWWLAVGVLSVQLPPSPVIFADGFEGE